MKLLALECATDHFSAALWQDGACLTRTAPGAREHARLLLPYVDELLAEAGLPMSGLDGIAYGRGPGSFTGLRIAAAAAQGLAFGADLPLAPVSTLLALAQGAWRTRGASRVLPALDARMQAIYYSAVERQAGGWQVMLPEQVCDPAQVSVPAGEGWFAAGPGWGAYTAALAPRFAGHLGDMEAMLRPEARDIAELGAALLAQGGGRPAAEAEPCYLRDDVIQVNTPRSH